MFSKNKKGQEKGEGGERKVYISVYIYNLKNNFLIFKIYRNLKNVRLINVVASQFVGKTALIFSFSSAMF